MVEGVPNDRRQPEAPDPAPVCTVGFCPICLAVTAVQPMRPETLEHLLNAGREFLLAARSLLDARAEAAGGEDRPTRLEKIDVG